MEPANRKPILFLAHLDVVEARREDWTTDPFQFIEKDGYFYGRGTVDMKDGDAILVTNFIRMKKAGLAPNRDLILALTADEEGGNFNGVEWLLKHHRDWIDAEYCVNLDGGDFMSDKGKKIYGAVQASEKVYVDFQFEVKNPGGHSSRPTRDNAIYHLSEGLARLAKFNFPVELNEITRSMLEKSAAIEGGPLAKDMKAAAQPSPDAAVLVRLSENEFYNAILRTTCVATMLSGGHAPNALPQTARANVNCRILPGEDPNKIKETLIKVVDDPKIEVTFVEQRDADGNLIPPELVPPSPLTPGTHESGGERRWQHLGPASHHARDGHRSLRRPLFAYGGHSHVRHRRRLPGPRQSQGAWPGRTRKSPGFLRWRGIQLQADADTRATKSKSASSKEKWPGEDVFTGPNFSVSGFTGFGLFGASPAFGSPCVTALAAIGLPASVPKRVR